MYLPTDVCLSNSSYRAAPRNALLVVFWLALLCALAPPPANAQCKDSDFPGPDGVTAWPSRPVESSSPDTIQTGVAEIETGYAHSWVTHNSSQSGLFNLVKLGVWCNLEVRWSVNSYLNNTVAGSSESGFGDNYLTGQYRFHRESAHLPSMAAGYTVKFPSANPVAGLGTGQVDQMATLMLGKNIGKLSLVANASFIAVGQGGGVYDHKAEVTFEFSRPIKGKWGMLGEVYYDSHLNALNAAYGNSTWGLTYTVNRRLVFDGGAYVGFSNGPGVPGNSIFFGVSYAPGRLFGRPGRKPPLPKE